MSGIFPKISVQLKRKIIFISILRWIAVIGLIAGLGYSAIKMFVEEDNANHRNANVTCIDKLGQLDCYKYSCHVDYVLVCREDNGSVFDIEVTPTTFATSNIGDKMTFAHIHKELLDESDECVNYTIWIILSWLAFIGLIMLSFAYAPWLCGCDIENKYIKSLTSWGKCNYRRFTPNKIF